MKIIFDNEGQKDAVMEKLIQHCCPAPIGHTNNMGDCSRRYSHRVCKQCWETCGIDISIASSDAESVRRMLDQLTREQKISLYHVLGSSLW